MNVELEDYHNPKGRFREESVELMRLLVTHVRDAIAEELDRRNIPAGTVAAFEVAGYEKSPRIFGIHFTVRMLAPDDHTIEFRGTL